MTIIDLSHTINGNTPVYPGDPVVEVVASRAIDEDGFSDHKVSFGAHTGTHIDAPAHMVKGGKKLSDFPLDVFIRPAVCIDASRGFNVESIKAANIQPGMAVLFYTGTSQYFSEEKYWSEYNVLDQVCIDALIQSQVSMVGLDACPDNQDGFPVHKALLGADILIIENIAPTLSELVGKTFELIALPLKLEFDGAPARVLARLA